VSVGVGQVFPSCKQQVSIEQLRDSQRNYEDEKERESEDADTSHLLSTEIRENGCRFGAVPTGTVERTGHPRLTAISRNRIQQRYSRFSVVFGRYRNMTFGDGSAIIGVLHRGIVSKRRSISEGIFALCSADWARPAGKLYPQGESATHVLVEPVDRTLPGEISRGFVIPFRRRVAIEAMYGSSVNKRKYSLHAER
jgi:hypothetical protein